MNRPRANAGFSLVEVVCAVLVLGVALVGLTEGLTTALRSSKESELQTKAAQIAAGQIETLRAEGDLIDGETDGTFGGDLALYRWKQSITRTSIDGLHEIAVVVENAQSGQAIYELRTLLFEPPEDSTAVGATNRPGGSGATRREGRR
jgi:prepilin-type N-terminal cleavage/methylation domain-containing protein